MRVAIVPNSTPTNGGSFQYSLAVVAALAKVPAETAFRLVVRSARELRWFQEYVSAFVVLRQPPLAKERVIDFLDRFIVRGALREILKSVMYPRDLDRTRRNRSFSRFLRDHDLDWVFYTTPTTRSFESNVPYVMPVFDVQHRLQPEFPEVSANGEWQRREYLYRNATRAATLILADSEVGKEDLLDHYAAYGLTEDRVKVLEYVPPLYLSEGPRINPAVVRETFQLPPRYLFYPAQFWPHKNHLRIVQAIGQLKKSGTVVHVVFAGGHGGSLRTQVFREVLSEAERLGVSSQVHYLGYVPNEAMATLYAEAVGLVMPTFFGPANIPVVEAWSLECPVLTSNIRGIREQLGDAGLLVDPRSVDAIADGMKRLWEDEGLRRSLVQRGLARLAGHDWQTFTHQLTDIVVEASLRVREHAR